MARVKDYRWVTKDPIIGIIQAAFRRTGNLSQEHIERVAYDAGVHPETIKGWLYHDVRFPRSLTTRFVLEALGVTISYSDHNGDAINEKPFELISETARAEIAAKDKKNRRHRPLED